MRCCQFGQPPFARRFVIKKLGLVGGLGPEASPDDFQRIIEAARETVRRVSAVSCSSVRTIRGSSSIKTSGITSGRKACGTKRMQRREVNSRPCLVFFLASVAALRETRFVLNRFWFSICENP